MPKRKPPKKKRTSKLKLYEDGSFSMGPGYVWDAEGMYVRPVHKPKKRK